MKRKTIKLSLEKEVISKLKISNIKGGEAGFENPCSTRYRQSVYICRSHEHNCHSNNADCDCGTTGNC